MLDERSIIKELSNSSGNRRSHDYIRPNYFEIDDTEKVKPLIE